MLNLRAILLGLALSTPALVLAQWQWVDSGGRRVFSDQPPPPDIPARSILKQPGQRAASVPAAQPAAAEPSAPTASPQPLAGGQDKELEARRKKAQEAEAQKRKVEEERVAKAQAENCARARQAKATFDSGMRLARLNDKGEREILDDEQRAAELKRIEQVIASECKPS
ncbi:DUF4124 domain-containing protein [Ramlibacter sp. AW1]|uniref:DUF4124 domain-containing protein n=1 Tax=Ramlibacter aurantiacus TaxID=2801330 RepID=A0A937D4D4_9BURK|nr:DUF4124 domain-containing protein [Ramlibacter aurantiacus]MBL0418778.1 DUF4124 domain-containing protein [Ramlibacter aurantiacus]